MVHAKYGPNSRFKPAKVVSVDHARATCTLQFFGYDDETDSIPLTRDRMRPPASAKREDGKLVRSIKGEANIIRDDISEITCGKLEDFPDATQLENARKDLCDIIHAASPFQHKTLKGGGVEKHPNPFKSMDAEQRTLSMMAKVKSINAYLDEHYPRPSGERSRSDVWQDVWQEIAFPA